MTLDTDVTKQISYLGKSENREPKPSRGKEGASLTFEKAGFSLLVSRVTRT